MKLSVLLLAFLFASCGTIKEFIKKGETHQKMATRLDNDSYNMDVKTLKEKVVTSFNGDHESPTIMLPMNPAEGGTLEQQSDRRQAITDALDDQGFSYKKQMYKNDLDINWLGLWKNQEKELASIKSKIKTGPYHVVEDTKESFMIVKGINVYKGESTGKGQSKLTIYEIKQLVRDPMQVNMAWFKTLSTGKLWFSIDQGPVSLEKSLDTAKKDKLKELSMLHYLDQNKFVTWEQEASL